MYCEEKGGSQVPAEEPLLVRPLSDVVPGCQERIAAMEG